MPRALLLSPDDQAVSAITGVLEEMSVTCERPLDGASAAKKLNSQNYDLVLVDCDNLPAAKLIFDVCRRSHVGTTPIAIVDGRAGLPTAFRLGAELILTKPVAKDQARTSIRTAVSRLHKEEPARPAKPLETNRNEAPAPTSVEPATSEPMACAAAASAVSSPQAKPIEISPATPAAPVATVASTAMTANTDSIAEDSPVASAPSSSPPAAPAPKSAPRAATAPTSDKAPSAPEMFAPAQPPTPKAPKSVREKSDESLLGELNRAQADLGTPIFASYGQPKKKGYGLLIAALLLGLLGGGFYAAWTYQPQFRTIVKAQLERAEAFVGNVQAKRASPPPPTPSQPQTKKETPPQAPLTTPQASSTPATEAATGSVPGAPDNASSPAPSAAPNATPDPTPTTPAAQPIPAAAAPDTALLTTTELPGERDAVILSSQGAEKRLIHHVAPAYPPQARSLQLEGTVVLRALINERGTVDGVRVVEGNPVLASAAMKAVKQWRYKPYIRNGSANPFTTVVLVDFQQP